MKFEKMWIVLAALGLFVIAGADTVGGTEPAPAAAKTAAASPLHAAVEKNDVGAMKALIGNRADVNIRDKDGNTPLHLAVAKNNVTAAEMLLNAGARQLKNKNGQNPLHLAAMKNSAAVAELLLKHGAKVNVKDKKKDTPLVYAVVGNHPEVAKVLVAHGADVNREVTEEKVEKTLIFLAFEKEYHDIAKLLINAKGAKLNLSREKINSIIHSYGFTELRYLYLTCAATLNNTEIVKDLITKLDDVNFTFNYGSALLIAAHNGNADICRLILDHVREINGGKDGKAVVVMVPGFGFSIDVRVVFPLNEAIKGSHIACVKLFVDRGIDVNMPDKNDGGNTPLHYAVQAKDGVEIVKILLAKGAKAEVKNNKGQRPIDLTKNEDIIELLDGAE